MDDTLNKYHYYYYNEYFDTLIDFSLSTVETVNTPYEAIGFVIGCLKTGELDVLFEHLKEEESTLIMMLLDKDKLDTKTFISAEFNHLELTELFFLASTQKAISSEYHSADVIKIAHGLNKNLFQRYDTQEYFLLPEDDYEILEHCAHYLE